MTIQINFLNNQVKWGLMIIALHPMMGWCDEYVVGTHVRYNVSIPFASKQLDSIKDGCEKVMHLPFAISGDVSKTNASVTNQYFSSDGRYMAEYQDGFRAETQGAPCNYTIKPYQTAHIYDFTKHVAYQMETAMGGLPTTWLKTDIVNVGSGLAINKLLDAVVMSKAGKPKAKSKSMIAGLVCQNFELNGLSWCEWKVGPNDPIKIPTKLNLMSKMDSKLGATTTTAELVNFKEQINPKLFQAPTKFTSTSEDDSQNADTNDWCLAQKKKTGKNPCDGAEQ